MLKLVKICQKRYNTYYNTTIIIFICELVKKKVYVHYYFYLRICQK